MLFRLLGLGFRVWGLGFPEESAGAVGLSPQGQPESLATAPTPEPRMPVKGV